MVDDDTSWLDPIPTISRDELLQVWGIDAGELTGWLKNGCPSIGDRRGKRFNQAKVCRWVLAQRDGLDKARLKEREAIAELRHLEVRKRQGELVEFSDVRKQLADRVAHVQNELMTVPARCSLSPDVAEIVRGELIRIINKFAEPLDDD